LCLLKCLIVIFSYEHTNINSYSDHKVKTSIKEKNREKRMKLCYGPQFGGYRFTTIRVKLCFLWGRRSTCKQAVGSMSLAHDRFRWSRPFLFLLLISSMVLPFVVEFWPFQINYYFFPFNLFLVQTLLVPIEKTIELDLIL
jgi:hypothetical protein